MDFEDAFAAAVLAQDEASEEVLQRLQAGSVHADKRRALKGAVFIEKVLRPCLARACEARMEQQDGRVLCILRLLRNLTVPPEPLQVASEESMKRAVACLVETAAADGTAFGCLVLQACLQIQTNLLAGATLPVDMQELLLWPVCVWLRMMTPRVSNRSAIAAAAASLHLFSSGSWDQGADPFPLLLATNPSGSDSLIGLLLSCIYRLDQPQQPTSAPQNPRDDPLRFVGLLVSRALQIGAFPKIYDSVKGMNSEDSLIGDGMIVLLKVVDALVQEDLKEIKADPSKETPAYFADIGILVGLWTKVLGKVRIALESESITHAADMIPVVLNEQEATSLHLFCEIFCEVTSLGDLEVNKVLFKQGLFRSCLVFLEVGWKAEGGAQKRKNIGVADPQRTANGTIGFKTKLMRIIANLSYRNPDAQTQILSMESLYVVLNHCNLDDANPYVREWAIVCVRNLCEGSAEVQGRIAALEAQGVAEQAGLREIGVEAQVDAHGRLRLATRPTEK